MDFAITETGTPIYPVTVEEMKLFSRVDNDDEDVLIQQLIAGVTGEAEDITGRVFAKRSFTLSADAPLDAAMTIPVVPCTVNSVLVDGKTIDKSLYKISLPPSTGKRICPGVLTLLDGFPEAGTVTLNVSAGGDVPDPVIIWIKTRTSTLYEQRESQAMFNSGLKFVELGRDYAMALLDPYILHGGF